MDEILETGIKQGEFQADLNVRVARQTIFGTVDEVVTNERIISMIWSHFQNGTRATYCSLWLSSIMEDHVEIPICKS